MLDTETLRAWAELGVQCELLPVEPPRDFDHGGHNFTIGCPWCQKGHHALAVALLDEIDALRAALAPFAAIDTRQAHEPEEGMYAEFSDASPVKVVEFTAADVRRAAALLGVE